MCRAGGSCCRRHRRHLQSQENEVIQGSSPAGECVRLRGLPTGGLVKIRTFTSHGRRARAEEEKGGKFTFLPKSRGRQEKKNAPGRPTPVSEGSGGGEGRQPRRVRAGHGERTSFPGFPKKSQKSGGQGRGKIRRRKRREHFVPRAAGHPSRRPGAKGNAVRQINPNILEHHFLGGREQGGRARVRRALHGLTTLRGYPQARRVSHKSDETT